MTKSVPHFSLATCLLSLVLSGCSLLSNTAPPEPPSHSIIHQNLIAQDAADLLSTNQAPFTAVVPSTGQILAAQSTYFSAANRICRNIELRQQAGKLANSYIACRVSDKQWQLNKALP